MHKLLIISENYQFSRKAISEIDMVDIKKWEDKDHWVEIDLDKCVGAEDCVNVCPVEVYELVDGKVIAENIGECTDCMACQDICPTDAIIAHSSWQ